MPPPDPKLEDLFNPLAFLKRGTPPPPAAALAGTGAPTPVAAPTPVKPAAPPTDPNRVPIPPFDPNAAPAIKLTPQERAAINRDINKVAIKFHEASGIQLWGFYKIHDISPFWGPLGFEFMCDDWQKLLNAADRSRLGFDIIDMPYSDWWAKNGIKSVGYTQSGKPPHVHLDVAIDRPGLCRLYLLDDNEVRRVDALRRSQIVTARSTDVFKVIFRRMEGLGIDLDNYIGKNLEANRSVLDGINFVATDHNDLINVLTNLKYPAGDNVFFRGSRSGRGHFVGNLSFLATDGIGFRQIWQTFPSERPIAKSNDPNAPAVDTRGSARFGDNQNLPDLTSVHIAVSKRLCNVHIDQMGFMVTDQYGTRIVDPDALRHIFVELLWKTDLQGKLPFWALDNINFVIPSSPNDFSRVGVTIDVAKFGKVNVALNGTCSVDGHMETAGTLTLGFKF